MNALTIFILLSTSVLVQYVGLMWSIFWDHVILNLVSRLGWITLGESFQFDEWLVAKLITAAIIDHLGWFETEIRPFGLGRILFIGFMFAWAVTGH